MKINPYINWSTCDGVELRLYPQPFKKVYGPLTMVLFATSDKKYTEYIDVRVTAVKELQLPIETYELRKDSHKRYF